MDARRRPQPLTERLPDVWRLTENRVDEPLQVLDAPPYRGEAAL
jgi:hypothetical protein